MTLRANYSTKIKEYNGKIMGTSKYNFMELFQAHTHLKIMRTFIDGVLSFGIPPKFYLGIIKPNKGADKKIMD